MNPGASMLLPRSLYLSLNGDDSSLSRVTENVVRLLTDPHDRREPEQS